MVEILDGLIHGADWDVVKIWQQMNAPRFDNIVLKTKTVGVKATPDGKKIAANKAGVAVIDRGLHQPHVVAKSQGIKVWKSLLAFIHFPVCAGAHRRRLCP